MKTISLVGFLLGFSYVATLAQTICPPVIQWQKSFGTPSYENAKAVIQTRDGGFVIGGLGPAYPAPGGNKTSPDYGGRDFWIVRTDSAGNKLWDRTYGGTQDDLFEVVRETSDGGFILGGTTWYDSYGGNKSSTNYGISDFWVVRTDVFGNKLWDRSYGGLGFDFLSSIEPTSDGGFILAGSSSSPPSGTKTATQLGGDDFWVVRIDADGNQLWDRTYGGDENDQARAIRQTANGGFIVGGSTQGLWNDPLRGSFGGPDYWVVRLDANGNRVWDTMMGGSLRDELQSIALTSDGGCIVGGWSESGVEGNKTSPGYGSTDFWVVRLNSQGNKVWERSYGGDNNDALGSVSTNADGGFLFAGYSCSLPSGTKTARLLGACDYWLVRTDANGNELWQGTFGGSSYDTCSAAAQTTDGGYIAAGISGSADGDRHGAGFGADDFWLVKLTPENADDCDHDGVPNAQDQCPGTALGSLVNAQGCSIEQICPCDMDFHDAYVACVRDAARAFQQAGLISNGQRHQIIETARAASCPPSSGPGDGFIFGLPHRALGTAKLAFLPDWSVGLYIYPEDQSVESLYGVSVALGHADSGLFIYPSGNQSNFGDSWFLDVTAYGPKDRENNDALISSVQVRKPYYESYPVDVDLGPLDPDSVTVQILSNRTVVAEVTFPGSSAAFYVNGYAYLQPRGNPYWRMPDGSVGVLVEFTNPSAVEQTCCYSIGIGGTDQQGLYGNQIFVRANHPRHKVQYISRIDAVAGGGVPSFYVINERLGVFNHANQAFGSVLFNALRGSLQVTTLDAISPEDFAAILVEAPDGASRLEIDLDAVQLEKTGAALVVSQSGGPGLEPLLFGNARITREPDQLAFSCDFEVLFDTASSNSPLVRVEALRNGRVTGSAVLSGTAASGSFALDHDRAPQIIGCRATINSNGVPTFGVSFAGITTFHTDDGAIELTGNHIRVTPLNPANPIASISAITFEMIQLQSITITDERSALLPPTLSVQAASGELLLNWIDKTRLYSLESASSLSGPFGAVTNDVEVINEQSQLRLPISNAGARFFRLSAPAD